ncbi:MAG: cupin domain-containing protein [Actinomycetota bacterium]|nr:cupin domain-containing protein [Actinomycetota bacterium]
MSGVTVAARGVKVVRPGEGRSGGLMPGVGVIFKIDGADSGGALAIVEHPFEVGALVPPHIHHREDEFSIVLEGEIGFRSEDAEVVLGAGGYIVKPRGEVHAMWNAGKTPARMIEIISPAGFEDLFRSVVDLAERGEADMPTIVELANGYEVPLAEPDWLADVIERYQLSVPTG